MRGSLGGYRIGKGRKFSISEKRTFSLINLSVLVVECSRGRRSYGQNQGFRMASLVLHIW